MRTIQRVTAAIALTISAWLVSAVVASPADAAPQGNWDAPPTCFKGAEWHYNNYDPATGVGDQLGNYQYQGQVTEQVIYGGGYETRYYWYYFVSYPAMTGPFQYGMVDAGIAYKHCGTTWTAVTA